MIKSSIANKLSVKRNSNNFDLLRFAAATMVIVSHSFALHGSTFEPMGWLSHYETFGGLAVAIFFIISGFLVTGSWCVDPNIFNFVKKRVLRIFPGLIWVVLLTVFVLGPLLTTLSRKEYFSNPGTYIYLHNIYLTYIYYGLPGVFAHTPYPNAVNGSLWTMPIEMMMYVMIAILGLFRCLRVRWFIALLLPVVLYIFVTDYLGNKHTLVLWFLLSQAAKLAIYYIMGSLFYIYRDKIPLNIYIFIPAVILYFAGYRNSYGHFTAFIALPYITLYVASLRNSFTNYWGKYGDFSYGMYIYAFPVQQTIMNLLGNRIDILEFFLLSFIFTLLLSVQSWYLVEQRALRLKNFKIAEFLETILKKTLLLSKQGIILLNGYFKT